MTLALFNLITFYINIFTGIIVFARARHYALIKHYVAVCLLTAIGVFFEFLSLSATSKATAWVYSGANLIFLLTSIAATYHLILRVVQSPLSHKLWYTILIYISLPLWAYLRINTRLLTADLTYIESLGYIPESGPLSGLIAGFALILNIGALAAIIMYSKRVTHPKERQSLKLLLLAVTIPIVIIIINRVGSFFFDVNVNALRTTASLLSPLILLIALARIDQGISLSLFSNTIKSTFFTLTTIALIVAILPAMTFMYMRTQSTLAQDATEEMSLRLHNSGMGIDDTLQSYKSLNQYIVQYAEVGSFLTHEHNISHPEMTSRLQEASELFQGVISISITNPQGTILISSDQQDVGRNLAPIQGGIIHYYETSRNEMVFQIINPIYQKETLLGYTVIANSTSVFEKNLLLSPTEQLDSRQYLISKEGEHLLAQSPYEILFYESNANRANFSKQCNAAAANEHVLITYNDSRNMVVIASIMRLNTTNWCVIFEQDASVVYGPLQQTIMSIIAVSLSILLFLVFFIEWIGTSVSRPIEKLQEGMNVVAGGNYNYDISLKSTAEIEGLVNAFKKMTSAIKDSRTYIDQQVNEQTRDLKQQKESLVRQQSQMVGILNQLEEEKEKSDLLTQDLQKFQEAVANASDHIVITDKEGTIVYANNAVKEVTGFSPQEVLGQKVGSKQNWGGQMSAEFYERLWTTLVVDKKPFAGEIRNIRKDKTPYTVFATISPILNAQGDIQFFVGIERDITREKEIDKAKTELVSLASHQLRTPLSSINWYTEMLLDGDAGELNKEQKQYLSEIAAGNKRMVDLVNALLNVSRIELDTFSVDPEPTHLDTLVRDTLNEQQQLIKSKNLEIVTEFDKLPTIMVDRKLTFIIFQNIISNALKYTPEKGVVTISLKKLTNSITFTVTDTGIGIPKEQQEQIFSKMFRASNAKESIIEGNGLGLYIVKSILEHTRGRITFSSIEGKGSTFVVTLPLSGMKKKTGTKKLD